MWRWGFTKLSPRRRTLRSLSTNKIPVEEIGHLRNDQGSWDYASEWGGPDAAAHHLSNSVFRASSLSRNGLVSVLSYPSSLPSAIHSPTTENWLRKRYAEVCSDGQNDEDLKVLGYQWRVLRFNDVTCQSTVKVMALAKISDPYTVYIMQQPHCLAMPYIRSMISVGMTALSTCNYDLPNAVSGKKKLRVLCVGHGGGSLPLFLASEIQGAVIDIVEIDPLVISASINAMGFPSFSSATLPGQHTLSKPSTMDEVLWRGIHERLFLHESDAEKFILDSSDMYDIIFIDAYDGDDIFPRKLWDPQSPFLESLSRRLDPSHGTVVVNLHSDADIVSPDALTIPSLEPNLPMGKYVSQVSRAYKDMLVGEKTSPCGEQLPGFGFIVSVPWVCNTTLVVCRGFGDASRRMNRHMVFNSLVSNCVKVGTYLDLPFCSLEYLKRGFVLLD